MTSSHSSDSMDTMLTWLAANGAEFSDLEIVSIHASERIVRCAKVVRPGQTVLFVPDHLIVRGTPKGQQAPGTPHPNDFPLISKHGNLVVTLLGIVADPKAFHRPYVDALPADFHHFPLYADAARREAWADSSLGYLLKQRFIALDHDYDLLCRNLPGFAANSRDDFHYLMTAANSRTFTDPHAPAREDAVLVPLMDMFNHHVDPDCTWAYDDTRRGFTLTARRKIEAGAECTISYGRKSSARFLANYGFVEKEPSLLAAHFDLTPEQSDPLHDAKRRLLETMKGPWFEIVPRDTKGWRPLLTGLRCGVADLDNPRQRGRLYAHLPLTLSHEQAALRHLRHLAEPSEGPSNAEGLDDWDAAWAKTLERENIVKRQVHQFADAALTKLDDPTTVIQPPRGRGRTPSWFQWYSFWLEQTENRFLVEAPESETTNCETMTLQPVTLYSWPALLRLELHEEQRRFVASPKELQRQSEFSAGQFQVMSVQLGRTLIGLLTLSPSNTKTIWLDALQIDVDHQSRGHARHVMSLLKQNLIEGAHFKEMRVQIHEENTRALAFFETEGFAGEPRQPDSRYLEMVLSLTLRD